jgi:aminoglycoside phosphotransferase (APT) family kinase protein
LWERACATRCQKRPVWIHGDFSVGNILINNKRLSGVIDFGGTAMGDPACDLVIAWTYLYGKAREIFIREIDLDNDTWLRARSWALWKATFELCQIEDKDSPEATLQKKIIDSVLNEDA